MLDSLSLSLSPFRQGYGEGVVAAHRARLLARRLEDKVAPALLRSRATALVCPLEVGVKQVEVGTQDRPQTPPIHPCLANRARSLSFSLSLSLSLALSSELVPFETQTLVGNLCSRNRKIATINTGH